MEKNDFALCLLLIMHVILLIVFFDYIEQEKGVKCHTRGVHHSIQPLELVMLICKTFYK